MSDNSKAEFVGKDGGGYPVLRQPKGTATARVMTAAIAGAEKNGYSVFPGDVETNEEGKQAYLALLQFASDYTRSVFGGE